MCSTRTLFRSVLGKGAIVLLRMPQTELMKIHTLPCMRADESRPWVGTVRVRRSGGMKLFELVKLNFRLRSTGLLSVL